MRTTLTELKRELRRAASPVRTKISARFFKTGKGQYGEGDVFWGITVPETRAIAKKYVSLKLPDVKFLLSSKIHEERLTALLILTEQFKRSDVPTKKKIFYFYLAHSRFANNWDLVDLSADKIAGEYLWQKPKKILYRLAKSENVWQRRISIIATFAFIKKGNCSETFRIAKILLRDKHDLIQKAAGWMLREAGKKCGKQKLEKFLRPRCQQMPRTMLRYAIERFSKPERKHYLTR